MNFKKLEKEVTGQKKKNSGARVFLVQYYAAILPLS